MNNNDCDNDNTYLILFIVFLIGFIYYYCRNNANKKIKRFQLSKRRNFNLLNYKNGCEVIRNKKQN